MYFEDFKILSLRNFGKNDEKMLKNPKNHEFSILDKSADLADFNDRQVRKCVYNVFSYQSEILDE